jgi:hypothetical protein
MRGGSQPASGDSYSKPGTYFLPLPMTRGDPVRREGGIAPIQGALVEGSVLAEQLSVHKHFEGLSTVPSKKAFAGLFNANGMWFRLSY